MPRINRSTTTTTLDIRENGSALLEGAGQGSPQDMGFMLELMNAVEGQSIPAPCPIEQRWTSASNSVMSPAQSTNPSEVFVWVGVTMYLPPNDEEERNRVTQRFNRYASVMENMLDKHGAVSHWAKQEIPESSEGLQRLRSRIRRRFDVEEFVNWREKLDPKHILSNQLLDTIFDSDQNHDS
eukprot:c17855_g1_i1.p1 GENE.c17855_g1_i1~~c17855_g1_i1.p1  ORF type:complete len:182 (-),score=49.89 c17855_g1_i1:1-546(-)